MKSNVFIECELPNVLSEEQTIEYFKKYQTGDLKARDLLIKHNIKLAIYHVHTYFSEAEYETQDLISIAIIGLINAVNTYDLEKRVKFQTYASKCMFNEITLFLRKNNKHTNIKSLNEIINEEANGKEITVMDSIADEKVNVSDDCIRKMINEDVLKEVENLVGRNREIVKLYYGFYDNRCYSQKEISEIYGITRQNVSMIITKELRKIAKRLERKKVLESKDINVRLLSRK